MRVPNAVRDERGFSMFLVIMVMMACSLFVAGAYGAARGDLPLSGDSRDRKLSYTAAEAGLNFYGFHLNQDNDYWLKCTSVAPPNAAEASPVSKAWNGAGADPRVWRNLPGAQSQYTVELMPANGNPACLPGQAATMLDASTGTFRVRVTGRPYATSDQRRSIMATYRRTSFLDFLYFTQYETMDPLAYPSSQRAAAELACGNKPRAARASGCKEIVFIEGDGIAGPFHSNDTILTCGKPYFGRDGYTDRLTVAGPAPGYVPYCANEPPDFKGDFAAGVDSINMPPSNTKLRDASLPVNRFVGKTYIEFTAGSQYMRVKTNGATSFSNQLLPANGVIYVDNGTGFCNSPPPTEAAYNESAACGNLYVRGTYPADLTLGAANDIIVNGDLRRSGDTVMGLVANNFVRVYHPVGNGCGSNQTGTMSTVTIQAAILTLQHSFMADNHACGAPLGNLVVQGAIAQKYRGVVGTFDRDSNGDPVANSGYKKVYSYDDRLRYRTPPFFLQPESSAWNVIRSNEQVPAR